MIKKLERFNLSNKTALVTGAAGLLGQQHAAALLEINANVILTDISPNGLLLARKNLEQEFGVGCIEAHILDVTEEKSIASVLEDFSGKRVDILINNAAIDPKVQKGSGLLEASRLENFPLDQWQKQIDVGLTGAFLCSKIFGSAMASDGLGGVILNIASDLSIISPDQRLYSQPALPSEMQPVKPVTYSVIKAGLVGLTLYLSTYWANHGVRVNALSPGGVFNGQEDEFVNRIKTRIPMGRMANVDEYRSAVQFLCSDASSYMNGQNIVIDGGRSAW